MGIEEGSGGRVEFSSSGMGGGFKAVEGKPGEFVANMNNVPVTTEFSAHAEVSRSRWDLIQFLTSVWRQYIRRLK